MNRQYRPLRAFGFSVTGIVVAVVSILGFGEVPIAMATSTCPTDLLSSLTPYNTNYSDSDAVNVGVKFKTNGGASIQGVTFYKGVDNTGTHVAHLREVGDTSDLASATFTDETSSGWQTVNFSHPVDIVGSSANSYEVWVSMPNGHYAVDGTAVGGTHTFYNHSYGDPNSDVAYMGPTSGLYTYSTSDTTVPATASNNNYWVSPIVGDGAAPTDVTSLTAADDTAGPKVEWAAGAVDTNSTGDNRPAQVTVSRTTGGVTETIGSFQNSSAALWPDVSGSGEQQDVTALPGTSYTYTVQATDFCGNPSSGVTSSSITTASQSLSHIFTTNPTSVDTAQTAPVAVGMHWQTSVAGKLWGIRIYRDASAMPANTDGAIRANLWDGSGSLIASSWLPRGNDQSGWIDVRLATPVDISANHDYVVGYYSPNGRESYTTNALHTGVTNGSLVATTDSFFTPNGIYTSGVAASATGFPAVRSSNSTWYGVDVDFYVP